MVGIRLRGTATATDTDAISEQEWVKLRQYLGLSQLQTEIVRRLLLGKSRQEIAHELAIGSRTVRTHTDRVCHEFGVSNRVHLVLHVLAAARDLWEREERSL